jgi:hypothetical protein
MSRLLLERLPLFCRSEQIEVQERAVSANHLVRWLAGKVCPKALETVSAATCRRHGAPISCARVSAPQVSKADGAPVEADAAPAPVAPKEEAPLGFIASIDPLAPSLPAEPAPATSTKSPSSSNGFSAEAASLIEQFVSCRADIPVTPSASRDARVDRHRSSVNR